MIIARDTVIGSGNQCASLRAPRSLIILVVGAVLIVLVWPLSQ